MANDENYSALRVWWIPQVPGRPFYVPVDSVKEGVKILNTLGLYDGFQFKNNIKPDYCNVGGLQMRDDDAEDGWCDWYDEDMCEDDPIVWLARTENAEEE